MLLMLWWLDSLVGVLMCRSHS